MKPWYSAIPPGNCGHGCRGPRCRCQANCTTCTGGKERRLHDQIMVTLVGYQSEKQLNGILEKGILQSEWLYIYIYIHIYIYISYVGIDSGSAWPHQRRGCWRFFVMNATCATETRRWQRCQSTCSPWQPARMVLSTSCFAFFRW